jgi:UDPglucose 6-dehydrogenase
VADREPIGVIGAGWVGLVTAACFAELGHEVYVRDVVPDKVDALRRGEVPIFEPGLSDMLARNAERLTYTLDMGDVLPNAQLLFCCVDTPPSYSGDADLSRVARVVEEVGGSRDHALVMKSTVPVGTGRSILRNAVGVGYVSNPEFLKEGTAVADFMQPDRVVVGSDNLDGNAEFGDRVAALYEPLDCPVVRTDVASAEMIKLASNAFLATKISFINEIANVSEELGANVDEVARGMGLDARIGPQFLRAGLGYGGSCLVGDETVLVRSGGETRLVCLRELFRDHARVGGDLAYAEPRDLEVLSWRSGSDCPEFLPVATITRRPFSGELVELKTKMGRRLRCTPDHPFVVADAAGVERGVKLAEQLGADDWLPIAQHAATSSEAPLALSPLDGMAAANLTADDVIVRLTAAEVERIGALSLEERKIALPHARGIYRYHDIRRSGTARLSEARRVGCSLAGASLGTARNGTYIPAEVVADKSFWRVVGLYIAEGHCNADGRRRRLQWSFHPTDEMDLVEEVAGFWTGHGVKAVVSRRETSTTVTISSRLLAGWLCDALGVGRSAYDKRIPDLIWERPETEKRALLAGMWRGDGSWCKVSGGPSVVLDYGTASPHLADGLLRLLGDLGVAGRLKVGRTAKSTCDNYWIQVAGADQVEGLLDLVRPGDRDEILRSISSQTKRIAPTGYRRHRRNAAWVRVVGSTRRPFDGPVYSLEVPRAHTFVTSGGLVTHNCFPKDVTALKQLAGNTGYHFQLLTAVIEVNELQKRRAIGKLQKHLGALVGKQIALLGVAFKPNTDDVREATSLVLAGRLQSEGAQVRVYDPIASDRAADMLTGARICTSAAEAVDGADAIVLVTEWPEFRELDWAEIKERVAKPLVVDGRNFLDRELVTRAGFTYEGVGR